MFFKANKKGQAESVGGKNIKFPDYSTYRMTVREKIFYTLTAAAAIYFVGFIFYRSHIFSAMLSSLAFFYPRVKVREIINKRRKELNIQFKDMLYALSSSLSAGKSIEQAFRDTLTDLEILYPERETSIMKEVECINRRLEMNETVEAVLSDFAKRSGIEDIVNFADVFVTCKRTGGNMVEIMKNASSIINDKIEIGQEIDTVLAQRKFEQKVLNILPVLMLIVLSTSAGDYIEPVFATAAGRVVTTISILLLTAAYFISRGLTDIRV